MPGPPRSSPPRKWGPRASGVPLALDSRFRGNDGWLSGSCREAAAEGALRRRHGAGAARVDLDRLPQRARQALEARLDDVVVVLAVEVLDVQRHPRRLREGLEPFLEQLRVHLAELRPRERD